MPAAPEPNDRLYLGIGLLSGGLMSFVVGAALQRVWAFDPCVGTLPEFAPGDCEPPRAVKAAGVMGIVMMTVGVGLTIPGAIITHRARRRIAARRAAASAVIGPRFVGVSGRF